MFLICAWINGWVNDPEAGDLRRHRAHYDIIVMPDSSSYILIYSVGVHSVRVYLLSYDFNEFVSKSRISVLVMYLFYTARFYHYNLVQHTTIARLAIVRIE